MSKEEKSKGITNLKDRTIKVFGNVVHVKTDDFALSDDTSKDMAQTPALLAYWGSVKGAAVHEEISVDGRYRHWLATRRLSIIAESTKPVGKKNEPGKKPNDDTIKAMIEADKDFVKWKDAIAEAADHVAIASVMIIALEKRANVAQSTGATKRVELDKLGATTPAEATPKGKAAKGKAAKAAKADPLPDVEEDEDEDEDDDFEEDESDDVKDDADEEETDEDSDDEDESEDSDEEEEDDEDSEDEDDDEDETPKRRAKKAGKKKTKKA